MSLAIWRTRPSTVGDRALPVVSARLWNSHPSHVAVDSSLSTFHSRLKSRLFSLSYTNFFILLHLFSAHAVTCHFGYCSRFYTYIFTFTAKNGIIIYHLGESTSHVCSTCPNHHSLPFLNRKHVHTDDWKSYKMMYIIGMALHRIKSHLLYHVLT